MRRMFIFAFLLFIVACNSRQAGEPPKSPTTQVAAARAGNGFVCSGDGTGFGCACRWGPPANPSPFDKLYSCSGMDDLCKRLGGKTECDDQWCACAVVYQ